MQVREHDSPVWTATPTRQPMRILVIEDDREAASWLVKGLAEAGHVADHAQLSLAPEVITRRVSVKAGKKDSVASIAARYKVRAADVAHWNDVRLDARFKPGEAVALELPVRAGGTRRSAAAVAKAPAGKVAAKAVAQARTGTPAQAVKAAKKPARETTRVANAR